jgi:Fur family ferric uptake transcriptional regulator
MSKAAASAFISLDDVGNDIRARGGRVTAPRVHVLALLRQGPAALSHLEIEGALGQGGVPVDRVTIYRVLDWLAAVGLAHKAADAHGTFRFSAAAADRAHAQHVHFRCTGCGGVFCLDVPPPPPPKVPRGFRVAGADFDVHGQCPACLKP